MELKEKIEKAKNLDEMSNKNFASKEFEVFRKLSDKNKERVNKFLAKRPYANVAEVIEVFRIYDITQKETIKVKK